MSKKRKLINLVSQRTAHINTANAALDAGNKDLYRTEMDAATAMNDEITTLTELVNETERFIGGVMSQDVMTESSAQITAMVNDLRSGKSIPIASDMVSRCLREAVDSAIVSTTSTLVKPTRTGTEVRGDNPISSVINMVSVMDLSGCVEWQEPYLKTASTAAAGTEGSVPTESEPVFRVAAIKPKLINTIAYVSEYVENLSPAKYLAKVESLALAALRKKAVEYMTDGDGSTFYGFTTATNTDSEAIYDTYSVDSATIGEKTLRDIVLHAGNDEETGEGILQLNKSDLIAFGDVRGTNEKRAVYEIIPDSATKGNTGIIKDGGLSVKYVINSNLTALSTSTRGASAIKTMVYGDTLTYLLGVFSDFSVKVDDSYKFGEGLKTVRGSCQIGGNLTCHHGLTVVTLSATATAG